MADFNDNGVLKLFGFEIRRSKKEENQQKKLVSPIVPTDPDGTGYVTTGAGHFGQYVNLDGDQAKDNHQLIMRYRSVANHPEVDMAIDEIINESLASGELNSQVEISLDDVEGLSEKLKKTIREEFEHIVGLLHFNEIGHELLRSWYIDGRIVHHLLVNDANLKLGIQEIRHFDSVKIRKMKNVKYKKDIETGVKVVDTVEEFYIYEDKPHNRAGTSVRISTDAVSYVSSGLLDESKKKVLSHLHKALKPVNQLRMMEDSLVIYRLARAPERRIFYIDVGNMPKGRAEGYMKDIMSKYRNKLVYDANTGQLKDDRKHMSMLEDFWLPRRENGRGTEISTLPGGENLGQIDDIIYFQKRLYRALNVPVNRLEQEAQFSLGRSSEISRDEVKFQKFIDRLRRRFSWMFLGILKKHLILKNIITEQDWDEWKDDIHVDFIKDNHFTELKESEIIRERVALMNEVTPFVGEYFSKDWVMKNVMRLSEDEMKEMQKEIDKEIKSGEIDDPDDPEFETGVPKQAPQPQTPQEPKPTPAPEKKPEEKKEETPEEKKKRLEKEKEKKEGYTPSVDDELTESMLEYMNKLNKNDE